MGKKLEIGREKWTREFDPALPPVAHVRAGDELAVRVWCASKETVTREVITAPERFYPELGYTRGMPVTGPIAVDGAQVGDTLMIKILDIEVADQGWTMAMENFGPLGHRIHTGESRLVQVEGEQAIFLGKIRLPKRPMIGSLGVTPAGEPLRAGTPGLHGGNMDCKLLAAGATLFLPVLVPGALVALGDLHAVQGDGELGCAGAEISGVVHMQIDLLRGADLPLPFLLTPDVVAAIRSAKDLQDAAAGSVEMLADFLTAHSDLSFPDANMLLSLSGDLRICQIVNPLMTCRTEISLDVLSQLGIDMPRLVGQWKVN